MANGDDVAGTALGEPFPDDVAGGRKSARETGSRKNVAAGAAGSRGDGESARESGREAARAIAIRSTPRMMERKAAREPMR